MEETRLKTYIPGFDKAIEGGFVKNSLNLVSGGAGTGKTIFCLQYLYNGVVGDNQNGLFVSFEENIDDLRKDAQGFGWVQSWLLGLTGDWIIRAVLDEGPVGPGTELANDGWIDGQTAAFQGGFESGEIAASRLVLGLHYPSDVLAGGLIGAALALLSFSLLQPFH